MFLINNLQLSHIWISNVSSNMGYNARYWTYLEKVSNHPYQSPLMSKPSSFKLWKFIHFLGINQPSGKAWMTSSTLLMMWILEDLFLLGGAIVHKGFEKKEKIESIWSLWIFRWWICTSINTFESFIYSKSFSKCLCLPFIVFKKRRKENLM